MQEFRQSSSTPPLKLPTQEGNKVIYMLPEQYPVPSSQPSQGDLQRQSYPRHYHTGTNFTNVQAQQSNNPLDLPLAVPNSAGYTMFDNQSASLFQQRYAHLLTFAHFFSYRSHSFPQTPPFATTNTQGWSTVPVADPFGASSLPNHFSFQPSSIDPTNPQTWPPSTAGTLNDTILPGFTSYGGEPSYHAMLSNSFGGTGNMMYTAPSVPPGSSSLPQLQAHPQFDTPSTQLSLTDFAQPQQSGSIGYSRSGSPTRSYSPSLGEDHKPTHARRPAKLNLFNLSSVPELQNLALSIQGEAWFLNGDEERVISESEAERNLGPTGHSVFIAFLQEVVDIYTKKKTGWECRICRAASDDGVGDRYEVERLDRGLKHVRHHFAFKKFQCEGTCGEPGW